MTGKDDLPPPVVIRVERCPKCNCYYRADREHRCKRVAPPFAKRRCIHHWVSAGVTSQEFVCTWCGTEATADEIREGI